MPILRNYYIYNHQGSEDDLEASHKTVVHFHILTTQLQWNKHCKMNVRTYNPSVRVGNWNEDVQLEEVSAIMLLISNKLAISKVKDPTQV